MFVFYGPAPSGITTCNYHKPFPALNHLELDRARTRSKEYPCVMNQNIIVEKSMLSKSKAIQFCITDALVLMKGSLSVPGPF